ncbi:MAG: EamA family transporter [Candidatus Harrisonbacteria bacterium]|nr:EamA family transporter [Candidatus Harrisonbacteria bacterium]
MPFGVIFCFVAVFLLWGGWPLIMRSAGASNSLTNFLLSGIATLILGLIALGTKVPSPSPPNFWRIGIAGVMMGLGFVAFNYLATHPKIPVSTALPIINSAILLVAVLGGVWFFSEGLTLKKILGIALLLIAVTLLRPDKG